MNRYSLILLLLPLLLNAEPFRFERLYNEKTQKTIDLIFDVHKYVYDPTDQKNTELAQDLEISDSVRGLLTSLDSIASNSSTPVDLYLETSEYHPHKLSATPEQERDCALIDLYNNGSLLVVDHWLSAHNKGNDSMLNVINADTYRDNHLFNLIWTMLLASVINPSVSKQVKMASYHGAFIWLENLVHCVGFSKHDLMKLKCKNPSMYAVVSAEWETFQQQTLQPFYTQFVKEFIDKNMMLPSAINTIKLRGLLPGKSDVNIFAKKLFNIIERVADFEFLIKVLSADADHSIIYAGGYHCYEVGSFLKKNAGFKSLIQVGYDVKYHREADSLVFEWFPPGLSMVKDTWDFLLYNGKEDSSVIEETLTFSEIHAILQRFMTSKKRGYEILWDFLRRTHYDKSELISLINTAEKNYINIVRYMYLFAIEENMPSFLNELLTLYPTYINSYFLSELNPLICAITNKNKNLVNILLDAGADRNITNYMHASPRNAAKKAGKSWVRLLQEEK